MKHRKLRIAWSVTWGLAAKRLARLVLLMLGGIVTSLFLMSLPMGRVDQEIRAEKENICKLVAGAICGVIVELFIRWREGDRPARFNTRALLIATTLVAAGLGLIVWLTR